MRLLIVGTLKGQLTAATKIAMDKGASVTHAERIETAMAVLRSGTGLGNTPAIESAAADVPLSVGYNPDEDRAYLDAEDVFCQGRDRGTVR